MAPVGMGAMWFLEVCRISRIRSGRDLDGGRNGSRPCGRHVGSRGARSWRSQAMLSSPLRSGGHGETAAPAGGTGFRVQVKTIFISGRKDRERREGCVRGRAGGREGRRSGRETWLAVVGNEMGSRRHVDVQLQWPNRRCKYAARS